jgi:hypothetical protein
MEAIQKAKALHDYERNTSSNLKELEDGKH